MNGGDVVDRERGEGGNDRGRDRETERMREAERKR